VWYLEDDVTRVTREGGKRGRERDGPERKWLVMMDVDMS
jgi:hypothetical protein